MCPLYNVYKRTLLDAEALTTKDVDLYGVNRTYIKVVFCVIEGKVEGFVDMVHVDGDEADDVLVIALAQQLPLPPPVLPFLLIFPCMSFLPFPPLLPFMTFLAYLLYGFYESGLFFWVSH